MGFSKINDSIVEIAAEILDKNGILMEDGTFHSYVRPKRTIPRFISELSGISNKVVKDSSNFHTVDTKFLDFIFEKITKYERNTENCKVVSIVWLRIMGKSSTFPSLFIK
jgi:DNA polymerase III epsilon subunit-like protein